MAGHNSIAWSLVLDIHWISIVSYTGELPAFSLLLIFQYAVKVRRYTPWSRGPLSWIPGMLVHALSISFATAQSSHNSEIYNIGVHAQ